MKKQFKIHFFIFITFLGISLSLFTSVNIISEQGGAGADCNIFIGLPCWNSCQMNGSNCDSRGGTCWIMYGWCSCAESAVYLDCGGIKEPPLP